MGVDVNLIKFVKSNGHIRATAKDAEGRKYSQFVSAETEKKIKAMQKK